MSDFRTLLLLNNLRGILSSVETETGLDQRYGSMAELKSILQGEIGRLQRQVDANRVNEPEPSVGVPA